MARRFFIDEELNLGDRIEIGGEEGKHIMILRHNVNDKILVNDKICKIEEFTKQSVKCLVIEEASVSGVPDVKITLFQALLKSDKMEFVIQKAVEIGASEIVPFVSKNVVVKLDDKDKVKKVDRWNKISVEASKQCGRSDIVRIIPICNIAEVLEELKHFDKCILAYENETVKLKDVLRDSLDVKNIAIIIGAEGGFDKAEVDRFLSLDNCMSVSLGKRILRAETASVNLLSIVMYELD